MSVGLLHFLRPEWLWALLGLPAIAWAWSQRRKRANAWRDVVDPHLLPHLLEPAASLRARGALGLVLLGWTLAVVALSGPAWRQVAQPSWQSRTPLVIALDLSSATAADDLPPSRLLQARDGGQVGLVAFADDAYTVAPLTDDAANVALFLDALSPDVMPIDGHRPDRAIRWSARLLAQAGFDRGDVLLLTDHGDAEANQAATEAARAGVRVSVLGLGTARGTTVRTREGGVERVSLDASSLHALASAGDGRYAALSAGNDDLRGLGVLDPRGADAVSTHGRAGRAWEDAGYWLLPPLMLLALFAFRRGGAAVAAVCVVLLLPPGLSRAQDAAPAPVAGTLWRRADQAAVRRMEAGDAAYRRGDFAEAARQYDGVPGADARYNLGNARAKQGRYEEAIAAYDEALRAQPAMPDAIANRQAVRAAMQRKPPSGPTNKQDPRAQGEQGQKDKQQAQGKPAPQPDGKPDASQGQGTPQPAQQQRNARRDAQGKTPPTQPRSSPDKADAQAQQAADAAQRERMARALQKQQDAKPQDGKAPPTQAPPPRETAAERERRLANEAWLRRIPDDPGGLLRAKFRLEYERRQLEGSE
jgi:Ca-activated chloride channel family protein